MSRHLISIEIQRDVAERVQNKIALWEPSLVELGFSNFDLVELAAAIEAAIETDDG